MGWTTVLVGKIERDSGAALVTPAEADHHLTSLHELPEAMPVLFAATKEAKELRGKTHPVLGKPIATIPAREFFRLTKKYGQETVHSKEFLKYYNKKFPELSPNKI